jgi:V/A-type H+-transporting ATPase subunit C
MQHKLLTDDEYRELARVTSVPLAVAYLSQKPSYSQIWASLDEHEPHRGEIEKMLIHSVYNDFAGIYRFADLKQRRFLDLYFKRYEITIMKNCLNKILDHRQVDLDLSMFQTFFDRHSQLDIRLLATSSSLEEFIFNLSSSEYYKPLNQLSHLDKPTLFDYEMTLDLYYFTQIWRVKDKILSKEDLALIAEAYGNKFDLLNLQWIWRARQFYRMSPADIYALIIPVNYKLKKSDIRALTEAEHEEQFKTILENTYYGKHYKDQLKPDTLEDLYIYIMKHVLARSAKKNPYSVAILYRYLYLKDHEIQRLTVALECIRYGITAEETIKHIFQF